MDTKGSRRPGQTNGIAEQTGGASGMPDAAIVAEWAAIAAGIQPARMDIMVAELPGMLCRAAERPTLRIYKGQDE